jgi:hypothetical protein
MIGRAGIQEEKSIEASANPVVGTEFAGILIHAQQNSGCARQAASVSLDPVRVSKDEPESTFYHENSASTALYGTPQVHEAGGQALLITHDHVRPCLGRTDAGKYALTSLIGTAGVDRGERAYQNGDSAR